MCNTCGKVCPVPVGALSVPDDFDIRSPLPEQKPLSTVVFGSKRDYRDGLTELPEGEVLRGILLDTNVAQSVVSLLFWGVANTLAWYFLGKDFRSSLHTIPAPPGTFDFYIYAGLILGIGMLAFGAFGAITHNPWVGRFDGVTMVIVGTWNVLHDFFLSSTLQPYQYTIDISTFWVVIGISQIIWGVRRISKFHALGPRPRPVPKSQKNVAIARLRDLMKTGADIGKGRLKLGIKERGTFPFYYDKTLQYFMWLLPDRAYCLQSDMSNAFEIDRARNASKEAFVSPVNVVDGHGKKRKLQFDESSLAAFDEWGQLESP